MSRRLAEGPVTILFTDVEGSTALHATAGDAEARRILGGCDELVRQQVREHGGREIKSTGDGFMIAFTSPRKAVACALAIREATATGEPAVKVRAGLHTGEVSEENGDLFGAAVNAAARICGRARGGEVLASDVVRRLCGAVTGVEFEERGRLTLRGFSERWRLYRVARTRAESAAATNGDGTDRDAVRRIFVGRQDELMLLLDNLEKAARGEPRIVLISGSAGMGKTALLRRFVERAGTDRMLRATGDQLETLLPFGVVEQLVRSTEVSLPDQLARLGSRSGDHHPEPVTIGSELLAVLGSLQQGGPALVVVDDAQWADSPSLQALVFALRRLQADRLLAVISVREEGMSRLPEGLLKLGAGDHGLALRLEGLGTGELQELGTIMSGGVLPREVADTLREHTGGNPLYARALLEELPLETLQRAQDQPLPSPRSFSAQVLGRLAGCTGETRRLVIAAAVLGMRCPLGLARRVAQVESPLAALEEARAAGLLETEETQEEYLIGFRHALIRAAVYHDIGPARRADLHRCAAELVDDEAASLQHRSAAAYEADDVLASDLDAYARREAARGAWGRAAAALIRAGRLSPTRSQRELRVLEGG